MTVTADDSCKPPAAGLFGGLLAGVARPHPPAASAETARAFPRLYATSQGEDPLPRPLHGPGACFA